MNSFDSLHHQYCSGQLTPDSHKLKGSVEAPLTSDILTLPPLHSPAYLELESLGLQAVQTGKVGAIVLAGGMATRFRYDHPKALFPILDNQTFMDIKVHDLKSYGVPIFIMTSFHTQDALQTYLTAHDFLGYADKLFLFQQYRMPRLNLDGSLRQDEAAPGHGDFVQALQESGHLTQFQQQGGAYLLFSNIDNLGATFHPALLGLHIQNQKEMTIEVAQKYPGDKGGAPARVNGRLQLVEGFLFPNHFNQDDIPVFNTATYLFSATALQKKFHLPWYVVEKKVDDQSILQFEHLAGDLSCELDLQCVQVDRQERFLPVKEISDLESVQPLLRQKFGRISSAL